MSNYKMAAQKYVLARLNNASSVTSIVGARIYDSVAPDVDLSTGKPPLYPLLIVSHYGGPDDTLGGAGVRALSRFTYLIKSVARNTGLGSIEALHNAVDALFESVPASQVVIDTVTYDILGSVSNKTPALPPSIVSGERIDYIGGLYTIHVS